MNAVENITNIILHTVEDDMSVAEKHYAHYFLAARAAQAYKAHLPQIREDWRKAADEAKEATRGKSLEEKLAAGRAVVTPYREKLEQTQQHILDQTEIADREWNAYQSADYTERYPAK